MSQAQTIKPTPITEAASQVRRVPVDSLNMVWVYCHFPMSWAFKDGKWIPELSKLAFRKGLNGQENDGDYRAPKMHAESKGGVIIEPTSPRLGKHKGYLVTVPAVIRDTGAVGKFYCSKWESPTVLGQRNVKWNIDSKGYEEFLDHIVDTGIIEPISRVAAEAKIDFVEGQIEHLMSLSTTELREKNIKKMTSELEKMRASLDLIEEAYEPAEMEVAYEEEIVPQKRMGRPKKEA